MLNEVQQYYGTELTTNADLKTNACCTDAAMPDWLKEAVGKVHIEVNAKYYGCGLVAPQQLAGLKVLDLGSGSGRDCYVLSQLVGQQGKVVGVDMTDEQLDISRKYLDHHRKIFGYTESNVEFHKGYLERLDELDLEPGSFDLIISNCVINLSTDKAAVLRHAYKLLKPGGEMYFSDVYSDRRVPEDLQKDPVLYGECLSGALYWNDFITLSKGAGFLDPRLVEDRPLTVENPELEAKLGNIRFYSATYRLFKLPELESACEDYGQVVRYKGSIEHHPDAFELDKHHFIETGRYFPVCGNTWSMLANTRFAEHFEFVGNRDVHFGIFTDCGDAMPFDGDASAPGDSSGGCGC